MSRVKICSLVPLILRGLFLFWLGWLQYGRKADAAASFTISKVVVWTAGRAIKPTSTTTPPTTTGPSQAAVSVTSTAGRRQRQRRQQSAQRSSERRLLLDLLGEFRPGWRHKKQQLQLSPPSENDNRMMYLMTGDANAAAPFQGSSAMGWSTASTWLWATSPKGKGAGGGDSDSSNKQATLTPAQRLLQQESSIMSAMTTSSSSTNEIFNPFFASTPPPTKANPNRSITTSVNTQDAKNSVLIADGYADRVLQERAARMGTRSPTQSLLDAAKSIVEPLTTTVAASPNGSLTSSSSPSAAATSNSKRRQQQQQQQSGGGLNIFDSLKEVVYGTVDSATNLVNPTITIEKGSNRVRFGSQSVASPPPPSLPPPSPSAPISPTETYNPAVKARMQASKEIQESLPDLQSTNPFKRISAQYKMWELERIEQLRRVEAERQEAIRKIKEDVYRASDFAKSVADGVMAIPGKVQTSVEVTTAFMASIPKAFETTVDRIASIPGKVQQTAKDVEAKVTTSIDKTIQVIEDVKALPTKVQAKTEETKKSIAGAVDFFNESTTSAKVMLGLEKPIPRPPKTPPPKPPTQTEMGWQMAGTVANGVGKVALWLGKNVADLTLMGLKAAATSLESSTPSAAVSNNNSGSSNNNNGSRRRKSVMIDIVESKNAVTAKGRESMLSSRTNEGTVSKTVVASPTASRPVAIVDVVEATAAAAVPPVTTKTTTTVSAIPSSAAVIGGGGNSNDVSTMSDLDREVAEALRLAADALEQADALTAQHKNNGNNKKNGNGRNKK